jgi:hypothetical protein
MTGKAIKNNDTGDFFEGNHLYIYLYKKTEKLASALYMVTNLISEKEILRDLLREKSINIFSGIMQLQKMSLTNGKPFGGVRADGEFISFDLVLSSITEIVSLLEIANVSGYISEMNFSILKREYIDLGTLIKTKMEDISSGSVRLPKDFFDVPNLYETHSRKYGEVKEKDTKFIKDKGNPIKDTKIIQNNAKPAKEETYRTSTQNKSFVKDTSNPVMKQESSVHPKTADIRHSSRRNTILELLQNKPFVTVKDVIDAIDGCSSKTLQRELLSLVNEGILNKKGERRWSTYSLA